MTDITNADRAEWARSALTAFKASHKCDEDDQANIKDLISDLLHLARREHNMGQDDLYAMTRGAADMHLAEYTEDQEE